ncbi:endoplasmic reticulum resident protein 27 [Varanus komodoensis]|uniref:endoplasmic reticulum resident protein 27 n=1 Tax=Varanus komodoensis TaxID=61221 RepID=UPI001CF78D40|nr:endoplasmic reticulum resident protein 27 [Varanus komodoensis]
MSNSISQGFLLFLLCWVFYLGYAEKKPTSEGTTNSRKSPELLEDVAVTAAFIDTAEVAVIGFFQDSKAREVSEFLTMVQELQDIPFGFCNSSEVLSHYNITTNTVSLFRKVDNKRKDLEMEDTEGIDATKLIRFVRIHELHWVTEYNPVTVIGLFDSAIETHLLLFTDKKSPKHAERMEKYRKAATLFQGKILFIWVDIHVKNNERVMSYFHLKKSQLPALAAYHTPDEEQAVLPLEEISVETVKEFCHDFLQKMQEKENPKPEDKAFKEEL